MITLASYILPIIVLFIIIFGFLHKVSVFSSFLEGAKEGLKSTISILPSLVALITAVTMFQSSGALEIFSNFFAPLFLKFGIPKEILPLAILRPISGSGSLAFVDSLFSKFGPDTFVGKAASIMMGSTETTFYAITVYFGAAKIKDIKYTLPAALSADLTAFIISCLIAK